MDNSIKDFKNNLIYKLRTHLEDMKIPWHLCGGFAIDKYLGKKTRDHKDIDITVSKNDMHECTQYLKSKGWTIVAPIGGGKFLAIDDALNNDDCEFDNIWCFREDADFIKCTKKGDDLYYEMEERNQTTLDFIEVLFNKVDEDNFYYSKNESIIKSKEKAFIRLGEISILSPEIILLHKARNAMNPSYKNDFDLTFSRLNNEQTDWLIKAMEKEYPHGHPWLI